jgi:hypothetical protein
VNFAERLVKAAQAIREAGIVIGEDGITTREARIMVGEDGKTIGEERKMTGEG